MYSFGRWCLRIYLGLIVLIGIQGFSVAQTTETLNSQSTSDFSKTEFSDTIDERAEDMDEVVSQATKREKKKLSLPLFTRKLTDRNKTFETGERQFAEGDYESARKSYDLILGTYERDAFVNYRMGLTMYRMASYKEARPYFETALRVDPNIYEAYSTLTASYILEGNVEEAKAVQQRLKDWRKQCGLMCVGDGSAFKAEYEIEGMLKWAKAKNETN